MLTCCGDCPGQPKENMEKLFQIVTIAYLVAVVYVGLCAMRYSRTPDYDPREWGFMVFTAVCPAVNWWVSVVLIDEFLKKHSKTWRDWSWQDRCIMAGSVVTFLTVLLLGVL